MGGVFNPVNLNVYHYGSLNPIRYNDPTGMSSNETTTIDYYEQTTEAPITITIDGEELTVGDDIDYGAEVPTDARVNVPDGAYIEMSNESGSYKFSEGADISLDGFRAAWAEYTQTEEYQTALRRQSTQGWINMGIGLVEMGGGLWVGSKGVAAGGGFFVIGAQTIGFALNDILASGRGDLIVYPQVVNALIRPFTYVDLK